MTVLIGLIALIVLSGFGLPVLALLSGSVRYRLLPALPIFGVVYLVVLNHALAWALPVSITSWVAVGLGVVLMSVGFWRNPLRWRKTRQVLPAGIFVLAVGAVGAVLAWAPSFLARTHLLVQASPNHDAVWYVAAATWIKKHPFMQMPDIGLSPAGGVDSMFFGPMVEAINNVTRLGQEMVLATLSTVTGIDLVEGFSTWLGIWVLLGAGAAWIFGELFRLSTRSRLAIALLLSVSSALIFQVTAQNASSLLGVALVVSSFGVVGSALRQDGRRSVPAWLAGATVAAALGVYSEYLPFLAVALIALTVIAPVRTIRQRLRSALVVVAFSLAIAPLVWIRAVGSTLFVGSIASQGGGETELGAALFRLLGPLASMVTETTGRLHVLTVLGVVGVSVVAIVGIVLGLASIRTRGFVVGAGLGSIALAGYLIFTANSYVGHRAVDMITPMVTLSAAVGWIELARRSRNWSVTVRRIVAVVTVAALVGAVGVNAARSIHGVSYRVWSERVVSEDFSQAAQWVDTDASSTGDDLTVLVGTLWDQLWLAETLNERADAAWVNLRGDLGYRANLELTTFWDGEVDRFALVGPGAFMSSDVALLERNERFAFIDWRLTSGVVAVPDSTSGNWDYTLSDGIASKNGPAGLRVIAGSEGGPYALSIDLLEPETDVRVLIAGSMLEVPVSSTGSATIPFTISSTSAIEIEVLSPIGFRLKGVDAAQETR
jgi:hypothetical protein